jgi:hypothetical protein
MILRWNTKLTKTSFDREDEQVELIFVPVSKYNRLRSVMMAILAIIGTLSLLKLSSDAFFSFKRNTSCACGSSIEAAEALGCHFDPIAAAWVRPECFDEALIDEFNHSGPGPNGQWNYYADPTGNNMMSLNDVAALGGTHNHFFSTQEWHLAHCTFTWRKQFRAQRTGLIAGKRYDTEEHIRHCEMMIKKRDALQDIVTGSGVTMNIDLVPHYSVEQGGDGGHEGHGMTMHH